MNFIGNNIIDASSTVSDYFVNNGLFPLNLNWQNS